MTDKKLYGTIFLKSWMKAPSGAQADSVTGLIMIKNCKEVAIDPGSGHAKFVVIVEGDEQTACFFGCEVKGFVEHGRELKYPGDNWKVG